MHKETHIHLERCDAVSDILDNTRDIWLQPPANGKEADALAIFLDGEFFVEHFGAPTTMTMLQREGALPPMWSLYVAGGERTRRWPESFCNPDFATFVCDELIPQVESKIGVTTTRLLTGVSLTGLGAAHLALTHPGVFSRVLCLSGSFWWEEGRLPDDVDYFQQTNTAFRFTVGHEESDTQVDHGHGLVQVLSQIEGVRAMYNALKKRGFNAEFEMYEGGHDAASWRRELPTDLRALWSMRAL